MIDRTSPGKFVADLFGDHLKLPELCTDFVVQVFAKDTGAMVSFQMLECSPDKLVWKRWVKDPHGYPGAQDPREPPCGYYEGFDIAEGKYRAVVMW